MQLTISSNLFYDDPEQPIEVRDSSLTVGKLLNEIQREYNLPAAMYTLRLSDSQQPLDPALGLLDAQVKPNAVLVFEVQKTARALLRADDGHTFPVVRQPALIGRPNRQKQLTAEMLDADLTVLESGPPYSTSRPHARISEQDGQYSLESLRDDNPAYVNDQPVPVGQPHPLNSGDRLRFGKVNLQFVLAQQDQS